MTIFAARRRSSARSAEEIERDLDDEIGFHLALAQRDLEARGASSGEARDAALARFGDETRIRARCRGIALEDCIMWKRVHAGVTITLAAIVLGLFVGLLFSVTAQRRERAAALVARERAEQVKAMMTEMIANSDPALGASAAHDVSVAEILDRAALEAGSIEDPEVEARIRATIEEAKAKLDAGDQISNSPTPRAPRADR